MAQPDAVAGEVPVPSALAQIAETHRVPVVAWLGNPDLGVEWRQGADLETALFRVSLASPAMWEWRDGVVLFCMPAFDPDEVPAVPLHADLIRARAVLERLPDNVAPRLLSGTEVPCRELDDESRALLQIYVSERTKGAPPPVVVEYERAVTEGAIQLLFTPALTIYSLLADRMPGELAMDLSVLGDGPKVPLDWKHAITWLRFVDDGECAAATLGDERVAIERGVHTLRELAETINAVSKPQLLVDPEYASRQVFVSVPPTPAADLAALVARACCLELFEAEGRPTLGTTYPCGDRFDLHDRNMARLLELAGPLTALPSESAAAQFAAACLPANDTKLDDLPLSLRKHLERVSASRVGPLAPDCVVRLIPAFSLRLYSPSGVACGIEIK